MSPALFAILAVTAVPPQPGAPGKLDAIVLDAITDCPKGPNDEIVVCAHSRGVAQPGERYRLPESMRKHGWDYHDHVDSVSRERHRLIDVGAAGTGSCSTSGGGGWTGCMIQDWQHDDEQRAGH